MAIATEIQKITGVGTADTGFIVSAQKFVVSSIPKWIMRWASTDTVPATHGGDATTEEITLPLGTDKVLKVKRGSFVAEEVAEDVSGFLDDTGSLHKPTNKFPKYYVSGGNQIIIKPDPDATDKGIVQYVDFSKVDDDSDLRSIVIHHACSSEYNALASGKVVNWANIAVPPALQSPDFGSGLSIDVNPPVLPTLTDTTVSFSESAPTYTKPVVSLSTFPTLDWAMPSLPVSPVVDFSPLTEALVGLTLPSGVVFPSLAFVDPDVLTWNIPGVPVEPVLDWTGIDQTLSEIILPADVVPPSLGFEDPESLTWDFPSAPVMISPDWADIEKWITDEEDSEMAQTRIEIGRAHV